MNSILLILYNLFHLTILPALSPFIFTYALFKKKYRGHLGYRLGIGLKRLDSKKGKRIWLHCLSLGEVNAARPLITRLLKEKPECKLILSATTKSGMEGLRKGFSHKKNVKIVGFPFDIYWLVKKYVSFLRPDCFCLIETDLWPNLLWHLRKKGIPTILINGSISSKSAKRLSKIPFLSRLLYEPLSIICMQSIDDKNRLIHAGVPSDKIKVIENIKFDEELSEPSLKEKEDLFTKTGFPKDALILIAGSTHPPEEDIILQAFYNLRKRYKNLRLIIAPRDIERKEDILKKCKEFGLETRLRSAHSTKTKDKCPDIFLLDTLGELVSFYSISHIAFVGGSLAPIGGHNILEPSRFKLPVLYGPHMESFLAVAKGLSKAGGGFFVKNENELFEKLTLLIENQGLRTKMGERGFGLIKKNQGAVKRYLELIEKCCIHEN